MYRFARYLIHLDKTVFSEKSKDGMRWFFTIPVLLLLAESILAQPVPNKEENIPYLMVFGKQAPTSWGDDDFSQTFFFLIPKEYKQPVFIWVFDPDVGGLVDEQNGPWNTRCTYSVYGGKGCW